MAAKLIRILCFGIFLVVGLCLLISGMFSYKGSFDVWKSTLMTIKSFTQMAWTQTLPSMKFFKMILCFSISDGE